MEVENHAEKKKSGKTEKKVESEEEVLSSGTESDYEPSHSEGYATGSSTEEEEMSESEKVVIRKKASAVKRKRSSKDEEVSTCRAAAEAEKRKNKKMKKDDNETTKKSTTEKEMEGEKSEKSFKEKKEGPQKKVVNFDGGRVDFNLHTEDPNNIVQKTVQISTGLKLTCKMLAGATMSAGKVTYPDWAALIFQKKIKDDKCFEFNVSLKDAPKLIEGLKYIISENKTFFKS